MDDTWPRALWLVRHGESLGNVASARAAEVGAERIDITERDADVGLSRRGFEQARALGTHLGRLPVAGRPTSVLCSPYLRARQTMELAVADLGPLPTTFDERLRDRELGVLDRLTQLGVDRLHPAEAEARRHLGKYYHRPSGGESWADVALRLRGVLATLRLDHTGDRVMIVAHDIVVALFRYLLEGLDEHQVLDLSQREPVRNGGLTAYELEGQGLVLRQFNATVTADGEIEEPTGA